MTNRARLGAIPIAVVLALLGARAAHAVDPTLYVHYTMNCTFTVTGDNGAPITTIPPGRYQVLVTTPQAFAEVDLSGVSDPTLACGGFVSFHLTGPGVNVSTTLDDGDGQSDQHGATLQVGTYTALDDRRPTARYVITVAAGAASTNPGTSTPTTTTSKPAPAKPKPATSTGGAVLGTLSGSVDTKGKLTLTLRGKPVSSLKSGRYRISVLDETSRSGFTIQKLGAKATNVTSKPFLGRRSVTLTFKPGQWFYYSPAKARLAFIVHA